MERVGGNKKGEACAMGYSVRMSMDDTVATVEIRSDEAITVRHFAEALYDIADQYVEQAMEDYDGDH